MKLHENRLQYHALCFFDKAATFEIVVCCKKIGGALRVNVVSGLVLVTEGLLVRIYMLFP